MISIRLSLIATVCMFACLAQSAPANHLAGQVSSKFDGLGLTDLDLWFNAVVGEFNDRISKTGIVEPFHLVTSESVPKTLVAFMLDKGLIDAKHSDESTFTAAFEKTVNKFCSEIREQLKDDYTFLPPNSPLTRAGALNKMCGFIEQAGMESIEKEAYQVYKQGQVSSQFDESSREDLELLFLEVAGEATKRTIRTGPVLPFHLVVNESVPENLVAFMLDKGVIDAKQSDESTFEAALEKTVTRFCSEIREQLKSVPQQDIIFSPPNSPLSRAGALDDMCDIIEQVGIESIEKDAYQAYKKTVS